MDKIQAIRTEIKRRINILTNVYAEQVERKDEEMMNYYHGKVIALEELRPFLDTLSEEPDKSLEKAARLEEEIAKYFSGWKNDSEYGQAIIVETSQCVSVEDCKDIARYFYQLGIYPKMPKDFVAARDYANYKESHSLNAYIAFDEGFTKGAEWQESQMPMPEDTVLFNKGVQEGRRLEREDSVECEVTDVGLNYLDLALFDAESLELKAGDKIKVIVLKAEEQI